MRRLGRPLLRMALAGDPDGRVLPVAGMTLIYGASFSTFWAYVGVFAVRGLGWRPADVGLLFLVSAPAAALANYLSGRLSDRVGRRRPIVVSFLAASATVAVLAPLRHDHAAAFALLVVLGVVGAPAYSLDRVLVADLVPEDEARERAYATVRVASNLGMLAGPPLAALLIAAGGWTCFLLAVAALGLAGAAVSAVLPGTGARVERSARPGGALRLVLRDRPFLLLLVSTLLGFVVYCGFEAVLPVVAVSAYGVAPETWGLLVFTGPLLVVLAQVRLTRAAARLSPATRLASAMLLMGLPFLALLRDASVPVIAAVIVVFVTGEMLWVPTSLAIAARLAPPVLRGSYFGALAATTGPAWTLTPFLALELLARAGVAAVWIVLALTALAGGVLGASAARPSTTGQEDLDLGSGCGG